MTKPRVRVLPREGDATRALVWVPVCGLSGGGVERIAQVSSRGDVVAELARVVDRVIAEVRHKIERGCYRL
jgi:hypothetical protein